MADPIRRERPTFPAGYGLPETEEGLLEWADVERRLIESPHYWLATVRPDGRPHLIPRWGVWVRGALYYDGAATTRHARNAEANPACSLSLEDGRQSVILEGRSTATRADAADLGAELSAAFGKYRESGYSPPPDAWVDGGGLRVFTPITGMAWFSYPTDATRFVWA